MEIITYIVIVIFIIVLISIFFTPKKETIIEFTGELSDTEIYEWGTPLSSKKNILEGVGNKNELFEGVRIYKLKINNGYNITQKQFFIPKNPNYYSPGIINNEVNFSTKINYVFYLKYRFYFETLYGEANKNINYFDPVREMKILLKCQKSDGNYIYLLLEKKLKSFSFLKEKDFKKMLINFQECKIYYNIPKGHDPFFNYNS